MGPRPDGRGRLVAVFKRLLYRIASMGPRPDGRGRLDGLRVAGQRRVASMGPRPDGRGRRGRRPCRGRCGRRQWGRGRMAAEGCSTRPPPSGAASGVNGAAAGWPRKDATRQTIPHSKNASMGPRPDGRGRSGALPSMAERRPRQWGRGRMAAEGCAIPTRQRPPDHCVNGAAAGWPRKGTCFMGGLA